MVENWLPDKPLKVVTHGYLVSQKHDRGVFSIKKGTMIILLWLEVKKEILAKKKKKPTSSSSLSDFTEGLVFFFFSKIAPLVSSTNHYRYTLP